MSSAIAVDTRLARTLRFYETTLGKKVVMAVTGAIWFGYLIAHLIGNLQIFAGPETINNYALLLRKAPAILWAARIVLAIALILHITAAIQLNRLQRAARPVRYVRHKTEDSSFSSRHMFLTGLMLAFFIAYHIAHFTLVVIPGEYEHLKPYENVVYGFQQPAITLLYTAGMILVGLHLYHGLWSMFQTMGFSHPTYSGWLKKGAAFAAMLLVIGFLTVPAAVVMGVLR